jgi:hypothetical protein
MRENAQDECRNLRPPMSRKGWDAGGERWPAQAPINLGSRRQPLRPWALLLLIVAFSLGIAAWRLFA